MRKTMSLRIPLVLCFCLMLLGITSSVVEPTGAKKAAAKPQEAGQLGSNTAGGWGPLVPLDTVPVHISLLPDGRLLYWGRDKDDSSMKWDKAGSCQTYTWNPVTGAKKTITNSTTNLFCSGHSFMPDGRLLAAGGHNREESAPDIEGIGETAVNLFDYRSNSWERLAQPMEEGRWYPSTVTTANGETAIFSGKYWDGVKTARVNNRTVPVTELNVHPEMFTRQETLREFADGPSVATYPYLHLTPNGKVFISGTVDAGGETSSISRLFDPNANGGQGAFSNLPPGNGTSSTYVHNQGSSTLYDSVNGKVILTGNRITDYNQVSVFDLSSPTQWQYPVNAVMNYGRNYSTATLLPDGKVLVTGGTRCAGINTVKCDQFPNADAAATRPELWNPQDGEWTLMAPNPSGIARVYHSVAILLPDARVLVGGGGLPRTGGEFVGSEQCMADVQPVENSVACRTSGHKDAEIFSPPYLFDADGNPAPRPGINNAPADLSYGQSFTVGMGDNTHVESLVLVRLGSVTHGLNADQRRVELSFTQSGQTLSATAPAGGTLAPPGPYMLFALNSVGTPSVARMVNVLLRTNADDYIARRGLRSNGKVHVFYRHLGDRKLRYMSTPPVTNIALGKAATQSSVLYGGAASRAVDGNTSGDYPQNSVTHTDYNAQAWWQVDLGAVGQLDSVRVWNRTDGGADRVSNFYVLVSDVPFASTDLGDTLAQPGVSAYHTAGTAGTPTGIPVGRTGRYVRVQLSGANWLNLAEVEALGWSPAGSEPFSAPVDLAGILNSDPVAVENADGRLQVFVTGNDDAIYTRWELARGSGTWQGWVKIGPPVSNLTGLAAARNLDGRIQVFYRGTNNALWYISQTAPNSPAWSQEPTSLGGSITSEPAVGMNQDGRLEVFARGLGNGLHHQWQLSPGGPWSGWQALGGYMTSGPFVAHNGDGRLQVFARGATNGAHCIAQTGPNTSSGWTEWQALGGSLRGDQPSNNPVAALTANGRLQVFCRWEDNTLRTMIQNADGGFTYNGWFNLWGSINAAIPPPVRGTDGLFLQFARGAGDNGANLMVNRQSNANFLNWSGFTFLGDGAHGF